MMTLTKGSHVPPEAVRSAARRGLELRKKHGKGGLSTQEAGRQGIGSGVARASNLAAGDAVSTETLRRMVAFFSRHRKNKSGGEDDAGYIAWLLWGGDPGEAWAKRELANVDRVEKGTGPLQPIIDAIEVHAPGWLELPRHYALSLGDGLAKGLSHRYIRRVPTGKTTKTGKPRYRYYYHAAHGGTVGNEDHYVVGASFKDDNGHWHITAREGDKLTLKHDETGEDRTMTTRELREHLVGLHKEAIAGAQERARQDIADARASGATAKQVARLTERAARVGVTDPKDSGEGNGLKVTVTSGSKAGTYQLHQGSKKIASGPKHAMEAMGHWIREYGMNLTSNDRIAVVKPELQAAMSALGRMSSKFHGRLRESLEAGTHTQNPNAVQASVKMVEAASILGRYEDRNDPVFAATDADRKMFADRLAASGVSSVDAARMGAKVDPETPKAKPKAKEKKPKVPSAGASVPAPFLGVKVPPIIASKPANHEKAMKSMGHAFIREHKKRGGTVMSLVREVVNQHGGHVSPDVLATKVRMPDKVPSDVKLGLGFFTDALSNAAFDKYIGSRGRPVKVTIVDGRASYDDKTETITVGTRGVDSITHELGHWLESASVAKNGRPVKPDSLSHTIVSKASDALLKRRTRYKETVKLRDVTLNTGFGDDEVTTVGSGFFSEYVAKQYSAANGTEVVAMGIESLLGQYPQQQIMKDPEHLGLILAILTGRIDP